jgi:hypothetical protein
MTEQDFKEWVATAAPGQRLCYHAGYLPRDKHWDLSRPSKIASVAAAALKAFHAGRVHLVQRRIGPGVFQYLAEKRPRARK